MKRLLIILSLFSALPAFGQSRTETKWVSVTPTVTASSAYTAKDAVGGLMTFTNLSCTNRGGGRINSVIITDKADQAVEYDVVLFKSQPAGTFTNKVTFDPADADLLLMMPIINLRSTDHFSFNDNGVSSLSSLNSGAWTTVTSGLPGTFYVSLVTRGTPTYASTSDITLTLGLVCD